MDAFLQKAKKEKYQIVKISSLLSSQKIKSLSSRQIQTLRKQNNSKKSSYQKMVLTTEPALSFLFTNLGHGAADLDVGRIAKSRGRQATFAATFKGTVNYFHNCLAYAKWRYDYQSKLVFLAPKKCQKGRLRSHQGRGDAGY